MNVYVIGITGFVGSGISSYLKDLGFKVSGIYRKDFNDSIILKKKIEDSDVIINISGKSIAGLWTKKRKKDIYLSRIMVTRKIVEIINESHKEFLFINASAVGIYDNKHKHTEESKSYEVSFLADVINDWEREVYQINNRRVRWIILRMGIVISKKGGYMGKIDFMLKRKICIIIGKRDEYLPIISLEELGSIIHFIINSERINGIVNAVSVFQVKTIDFYRALRETEESKICIKIPDILIKLFFREASIMFLKGQQVIPEKLLKNGFEFKNRDIYDLLNSLPNS